MNTPNVRLLSQDFTFRPLAALLLSLGIGASAGAQPVLEEIVVTARKQSENLQSVPIAVSAYSERALENRGITNNVEIANFTPNVQFDNSSTFAGVSTFQAFIRGVGQSDFALNADPGVAVYVDGVYYARTVGSVVDMLDIERVEVLKGPQGTLFGRNAIGGAVNIITKAPSDEFDFKGEVTLGNFNRTDISGSLSLPIIEDSLLASVAFKSNSRDGYQTRIPFNGIDNSAPFDPSVQTIPLDQILVAQHESGSQTAGGIDNETVRAKFLWFAADGVDVTLSIDHSTIRDAANPTTLLEVDPNHSLAGLYNACIAGVGAVQPICESSGYIDFGGNGAAQFYNEQFITGDIDTTYATGANYSDIDSTGYALDVNAELSENLTLKSISAVRKLRSSFGIDIDSSPIVHDQTSFNLDTEQYSQEFQLQGNYDGLNFTAGVYYFKEDGLQNDRVPIAGGMIQVAGGFKQTTEAWAVFGEANFDLTDALSLNLGVRYTEEDKELVLNQRSLNPGFYLAQGAPAALFPRNPDLTFLGPAEPLQDTFDNTSVRGGFNWQINDDLFAYFSYSQGFKSGGFTTRLTGPFNPAFIPPNPPPNVLASLDYDAETAENFEIGFKSEFLDSRLRFNAAIFHNVYDDIQIVVQRGTSPSNENVAGAEIDGVELEFEILPTEALSINATLGYMDAGYTEVQSTGSLVSRFAELTTDSTLQNTPEFTASLAFNYAFNDAWVGNLNASYVDDVQNDAVNTPLIMQESYSLIGMNLSYNPNANWSLTLGGSNLTDERYLISGFEAGDPGFTIGSYSRPREWFFSVAYRY